MLRLEKCRAKTPMIAEVETRVGWCKLWDRTLEFGVQHARGVADNQQGYGSPWLRFPALSFVRSW